MEGGRRERERNKSVYGREVYGGERKGRKGKKRKERRSKTIGKQTKGTEKEREREKARGSNLPFSSLEHRVYQDEESQEGIKGV